MTVSRNPLTSLMAGLEAGALVFDGAMGTALYEGGIPYTENFDYVSVSKPEVVCKVHEAYLRAGAQLLTSNSFGANRYRLKPYGLAAEVETINSAAVRLAKKVAHDQALIGASVGPTGLMLNTVRAEEYDAIRDAFLEQCVVLCREGVDALILETFRQPEELRLALEAARTAAGTATPVVASVSFDRFGTMADGCGPEDMARQLADWGADAIGVNCADGPAGVYEMVTRMFGVGLPVIAQPNAGLPRKIEGRFAYLATPDYFLVYARRLYKAGVKAVGGCCGTTPEHIKKIAAAARMLSAGGVLGPGGGMRDDEAHQPAVAPGIRVTQTSEKGDLGRKLGRQFVVSVEVNPPSELSLKQTLEGAALLRDGGVDVINVADGPRASMRMGNLALCLRIQESLGIPTLMHVTTRDRNVLALVGHLLASHELGVRNLVIVTGDPPKMGDFPDATPIYDLDSVGLLRLVSGLNRGFDPGGKALHVATSFLCAAGAEPAALDYQRELRRLGAKVEAGAEFIMTQPVYDIDVLDRFLTDVEPLQVPILVGLLPLASYRNAEFLHNEVPGISVPETIRERMRQSGGGAKGRAEGVAIARDMLASVRDRVAGAYIMPPFGRYELALEVIRGTI